MSWMQAILLARGLSRGLGSICGAALTGAPFSSGASPGHAGASTVVQPQHNSEMSLVPRPPEPRQKPIRPWRPTRSCLDRDQVGERDKAKLRAGPCRILGRTMCASVATLISSTWPYAKCGSMASNRDLTVYNLLLDIFPKEVFRPRNVIQRIFLHYPRQQECGIAVLEADGEITVRPAQDGAVGGLTAGRLLLPVLEPLHHSLALLHSLTHLFPASSCLSFDSILLTISDFNLSSLFPFTSSCSFPEGLSASSWHRSDAQQRDRVSADPDIWTQKATPCSNTCA
uniref:ECSIT N-terminal domain-containing protein n=1 Tax=Sciurus vulgaris TaxID=55149 RepID=A0A8D2DY26_SCIVU